MQALGELYIADSKRRAKASRTVQGRESKLNAHVNKAVGSHLVAKWRLAESQAVMDQASTTVKSARGLEDVRTTLSALRRLAWREGWLDRSVDPLDGLEMPRAYRLQGAGADYVSPDLRPERRLLDAMAAGADVLCAPDGEDPLLTRLPLFGEKIRVAGYCGLRLGEQQALRAIDVYFDEGWLHVNGSWTVPRHAPGFRGPVKNHVVHEAPAPASLLARLMPRCATLLGLRADANKQQVVNAQAKERARRAKLARDTGDPTIHWWNYPVDPDAELWIFVDTTTGLPPRPELHNARWHRIREWVSVNDPENEWPETIVYRNLRHHAATFWHDTLGKEWVDVAAYLGDQLTTVLSHYVRAGTESLAATVAMLAKY